MNVVRFVFALLVFIAVPVHGQDAAKRSSPKRALNHVFKGRIVSIKKRKVTIHYDFNDPNQLKDFEDARPPRLLDASSNDVRIESGRLVLNGSTAIRHKMEGTGKIHARFTVRFDKKRNVGAVITEPILSDFYVVYNLFDYRFNKNGAMHIGACGLREDEGAEDKRSGLVNFRDIFSRNLPKTVRVRRDVKVEVWKDGWAESFKVGSVKGRGSSKGKTKNMRSYKFGLFVHNNRASFDDLTLTLVLSKEYLEYENLLPVVDRKKSGRKTTTKKD